MLFSKKYYTSLSLLFENDFFVIFPELFLVTATVLLLIYGVIYTTKKDSPVLHTNLCWLAQLSLIMTFLVLIKNPINLAAIFSNTFFQDDLTFFLKIVLLFGAFFSIGFSLESQNQNFEYIILILFSTCSMFFLISSADFISMYLAIELQSLCFYVLAAEKRNSELSTEAGLKYFILGAFSSGLLLFGCSMIYGFSGVTCFSELAKIFTCGIGTCTSGSTSTMPLHACELGMIFLLVGFLFKLAVVPFHMWVPDVYEGAPTAVTAFFAITPKAAVLAVFVRIFLESFYDFMAPWLKILIFCSLASMLLGALAAMAQKKIKRLLAFSSIGHVGYLLVGFCCGTVQGLQAMLVYLVIYMVMNVSLFAVALCSVRRDLRIKRLKYTTDLAMIAKSNPLLAFTLTITLFSMVGIPPLAGFYSKACLFFAAMSSTLYLLALVGVITSVISCFYYIRLIKIIYFETPSSWCCFSRMSYELALSLGFTFIFILFFVVNPSPLFLITHKIALYL